MLKSMTKSTSLLLLSNLCKFAMGMQICINLEDVGEYFYCCSPKKFRRILSWMMALVYQSAWRGCKRQYLRFCLQLGAKKTVVDFSAKG